MENSTILLTGISDDTVDRLKYWAHKQNLTPGGYVARLVQLHQVLRNQSEANSDAGRTAAALLREHGLR